MVLAILSWAIVIRCIISWIPHSPSHPLIRMLYDVTEPLLRPFRLIRFGGAVYTIDFSPIFAILTIWIIRSLLLPAVFQILFF